MIQSKYLLRSILNYLLILFTLSPLSASAQTQDEDLNKKFSLAVLEKLAYDEIYFRYGSDFIPLKLYIGARSHLYDLKEIEALELYIPNIKEDAEIPYTLVGKSSFIKSSQQTLFLITNSKKKNSKFPLSLMALDDSLEAFPRGSFRFINFTSLSLKVLLNDRASSIQPNQITNISSRVDESGGLIPFVIGDSKNNILYKNRLFARTNNRKIVLITPPKKSNLKVDISIISESLSNIKTE